MMADTTAELSIEQTTRNSMAPEYRAASIIAGMRPYNSLGDHQIIDEIRRQIDAVRGGDLSRGEAMLVAQAEALDALFYTNLSKAQMSKNSVSADSSLAIAVKALDGCCKVWATLRGMRVEQCAQECH